MTNSSQQVSGTRMWVRIALGVSLALNLLVVGLVIGAMVRFGGEEGRRPPPHSMGAAMFRALPQEDRRALSETAMNRPNRTAESRATETRALAEALQADPFDRDAVLAILDKHAQQRIDWQKSAQQAWLARVAQMSVSDRAKFADRLQKSLTRHGRSGHRASEHWGRGDN